MRWGAFIVVAASVVLVSDPVWAKAKGKEKKKAEKSSTFKPVGGPLPPLPKATSLSLEFDVPSDQTFAEDVSAVTVVTGPTAAQLTWTIADWRKQIAADAKTIARYRDLFAAELKKADREQFVVAVRYLHGVYESADQFATLGQQGVDAFQQTYPSDRDTELAAEPPEAARRVRLYLDRVRDLYSKARAFLDRTTKGGAEKVVRIQE